jgi:hypothetical protein
MREVILAQNRGWMDESRPVGSGTDGWYHVTPIGELPGKAIMRDGTEVPIIQVMDTVAMARIEADFRKKSADPLWPGYLVGREHYAQESDGNSEAFGWARKLEVRNDPAIPERERGIYVAVEKTSLGESVIGSVYKFFSPVFALARLDDSPLGKANPPKPGERLRMVAIDDFGLTNKPQFKTLVPAMNRAGNTEETTMLEKLKALCTANGIALADGADEDGVVAALEGALKAGKTAGEEKTAAMCRATAAEGKLLSIETAQLEADADTFVSRNKAVILNPAAVRAQFIADRKGTETLFAGLKPAAEPAPVRTLNRADGKPPASGVTDTDQERITTRNREREDFIAKVKSENRLATNAAAWSVAASLKPELFREEATAGK